MPMVSPLLSIIFQDSLIVSRDTHLQTAMLTINRVALVTGQLSKEITDLGKEIEKLFGVLNEDLLKLQ